MNKLLFLSLPFLLMIAFSLLPNPLWFSLIDKHIVIPIAILFLLALFLSYKFQKSLNNSLIEFESFLNRYKLFFLLSLFLFMLAYPFRDIRWGDGIILLETNLLETKLFGFQIAMDEILETWLHSFIFHILSFFDIGSDNRYSYQIISYLSGAVFLGLVGWKLQTIEKKKSDILSGFIFFSSSGFLIYFGYSENYSVLSLYFLVLIYLIRGWIIENRSSNFILMNATILVTLGIYLHLVSGFLAFSLFYLWLEYSPKHLRGKLFVQCTSLGGFLILIGFCYLLFLHNPTLDRKSSHLLHPPLYPWKRLISMNHFIEILSVIWFNSKIPVLVTGYLFLFQRKDFHSFFSKKENRFVLSVLIAFLLNALFINPMLGFPADWDMIGFYWIPFAYLAYLILLEYPAIKIHFAGLIFFCFIIQIFQAKELNKLDPMKEKEIQIVQNLVTKYVLENQELIQTLPKTNKKFYAKTDFFFYKSIEMTERMCDFSGKEEIKEELRSLQQEFRQGAGHEKLEDKMWIKDFLTKATVINTKYIKSLEEHNLCHLEL